MFLIAKKKDGNLEQNYCYLLECRLFMIFYRTLFVSNLFDAIRYVKNGLVTINFLTIKNLNFLVPVGDLISFGLKYKKRMRAYLKARAQTKRTLFSIPRYLFINFTKIYAIMFKYPKKKDFVYPIHLDIQRISGYY